MLVTLPNFFESFVPNYLAQRVQELETFDQEVTDANFVSLAASFHKITGSGGSFGLENISKLARDVDQAAQVEDHISLRLAFDAYRDYVASLEVEFEELPQ